jgi:dolichol-phosphate mannosyltransferase
MSEGNESPLISIVVPVYQEEDIIETFHDELQRVIDGVSSCRFEIIYVNDGSTDGTERKLREIAERHSAVALLNLSRNFGHQNALTCGFDHAEGDAVICIDADLQHPPSLIPDMIGKWLEGYDVVYTIRKDSEKTSFFKRVSGRFFYRLMSRISHTAIHENAADFRLISLKVNDILKHDIRERNRFLRGLVSWVGFRSVGIEFEAGRRSKGSSKYDLLRMIRFASTGIAFFSTLPLKMGLLLGVLFGFFSIGYGIYTIFVALFTDKTVPGWATIIVLITFLSAIQCFLIGLVGLYIGYVFEESKGRPVYLVSSSVGTKGAESRPAPESSGAVKP